MVMRLSRYLTLLFVSVWCCGPAGVYAQDEASAFTADLYGGLYLNNEPAWQLEPSVSWLFHKYLGVSLGLELTSQYNQPSRQTVIDGHEAELADNERNIGWLILKPSLVIKSPAIWASADNDCRLWVQAEPGLSLACPFRNSLTYAVKQFSGAVSQTVDYRTFPNKGLQWFYWNARASINFAIGRFIFRGGYSVSNFDYYSGRRNIMLDNGQKFYVPKRELSQSIFLSIGYAFHHF